MRKAFTLAEILVTIGIIGVIAAMAIPSLMASVKNVKNTAMLKEDYSILQQGMLKANDSGAFGDFSVYNDDKEMKKWFTEFIEPYIKTTQVCYDEAGCWYNDSGCGSKTISFILPNGSMVCMDDFDPNYDSNIFGVDTQGDSLMAFFVDLNGKSLPNKYGEDIFIMVFRTATGELLPAGNDRSEAEVNANCMKYCTSNRCGQYCMAKVKRQNFKLPVLK